MELKGAIMIEIIEKAVYVRQAIEELGKEIEGNDGLGLGDSQKEQLEEKVKTLRKNTREFFDVALEIDKADS